MIKANNAIRTARTLIGTPYSKLDCIALIREVIKRTAGGDTAYRCEGTNWLWRSINNSSKYKHLVWRQESIDGARAGMLAFKRDGEDVHHVGLVTGNGTVIHSSSARGLVVETELDDTWHLLGQHKLIEVVEKVELDPEAEENGIENAEEKIDEKEAVTIVDSQGRKFSPVGDFRVLFGSVD